MNKYRQTTLTFVPIVLLSVCLHAQAEGGIKTDGMLGVSATLGGSNIVIPENLGSRRGANLFHSFSEFNINNGQTVSFHENTLNSTDNVISRVTGSSGTDINGALQVTPGGKANFYLINPNGVTFGPDSSVDVPGSIHVGTADQIKFTDGQIFSAAQPASSALTSAPPSAFGFLGTSKTNNGLLTLSGAKLVYGDKKNIDLVAGNLSMTNHSALQSSSGNVRLLAMKGVGSVDIDESLNIPAFQPSKENAGTIVITDSGYPDGIDVTGNGGGKVDLWANKISVLSESTIFADNDGTKHAVGDAISIKSNALFVDNFSAISADTYSNGNSGNIRIASDDVVLTNLADIHTLTASGHGNSGALIINAKDISIDGSNDLEYPAGFYTITYDGSTGKAGDILVTAEQLQLRNGGKIESYSAAGSKGDAGNIAVNSDTISISGRNTFSGIDSISISDGFGKAGNIFINSRNLELVDRSYISTATNSNQAAGNITLNANSISLVNNLTVPIADDFTPGIWSKSFATGKPGSIDINFNDSIFMKSTVITTDSNISDGGSIILEGGDILTLENARITTSVLGFGNGGDINIAADILLMNSGQIVANTNGSQSMGGNLSLAINNLITSGNMVTIGGEKLIPWQSGIFGLNIIQAAAPNGLSGNIELSVPQLNLSGSLANLGTPQFDSKFVSQDYCRSNTNSQLIRKGNGGMRLRGKDRFIY